MMPDNMRWACRTNPYERGFEILANSQHFLGLVKMLLPRFGLNLPRGNRVLPLDRTSEITKLARFFVTPAVGCLLGLTLKTAGGIVIRAYLARVYLGEDENCGQQQHAHRAPRA